MTKALARPKFFPQILPALTINFTICLFKTQNPKSKDPMQADLFTYLIFIINGVFVGFISGLFMIGGGTAVVPVMTLLGYSPKIAVGISITQMIFSSIFNSYLNYKKGLLRPNSSLAPCFGGLFGGSGVGFVMKSASELVIAYLVLGMLLWAFLRLFSSPLAPAQEEKTSKFLQFFVGLCVGSLATTVGIGGAMLLTPALVGFCHFELKKAAGISGLFVLFTATGGFISMYKAGFVDMEAGVIIGLCSLFGVKAGNAIFHQIQAKTLKKLLLGLYIIMMLLAIKEVLKQHGIGL